MSSQPHLYTKCILCEVDIKNRVMLCPDKCTVCGVEEYKLCEDCDGTCDNCGKPYCLNCITIDGGKMEKTVEDGEYDIMICKDRLDHKCDLCGAEPTTRCGQCFNII